MECDVLVVVAADGRSLLEQILKVASLFKLVEDRWYHLRCYSDCFIASQLVDILVSESVVPSRDAAVDMCDELVRYDALHHVSDDHPFEDSSNFYRFTVHESESEQLRRKKAPPPLVLDNLRSAVEEASHLDDHDIQSVLDDLKASESATQPPEQSVARNRTKRKKKIKKPRATIETETAGFLETEFPCAVQAGDKLSWILDDRRAHAAAVLLLAFLVLLGASYEILLLLCAAVGLVLAWRQQKHVTTIKKTQLIGRASQESFVAQASEMLEDSESDASSEESEHEDDLEPLPEPHVVQSKPWTAPSAGAVHQAQPVKVFTFGAGGASQLVPVDANIDTEPIPIVGPSFNGRIVVRVLGLLPATKYFEGKSRKFSIQVQGQFTEDVCVQDLEFGAVFDRPIRLPWGSSIGLSLAHKVDRALREDLDGPKPWLMSPLLCGMKVIVT